MTATLITITGPIASGKSTVAALVADRCVEDGLTVVIADVDEVAAMVATPGAAASGLWFAAHQAHGALVAQWVLSPVDVVISVGPIYSADEQDALFGRLPIDTRPLRVLIDTPLAVTWQRVSAADDRGLSRQRDFHARAHARFRSLMPTIPSDLVLDSGDIRAEDIASAIYDALSSQGDVEVEKPTSSMPGEEVLDVLEALHAAGFDRVWVGGGWGVDALVGRQTRPHRDLDLAVDVSTSSVDSVLHVLGRRGYEVETDWLPSRVELAAPGSRRVDVHPLIFDRHGVGYQANIDGQKAFAYPPGAFARGTIHGRAVDCLSTAQQLEFHRGYTPREQDLHDTALLRPEGR